MPTDDVADISTVRLGNTSSVASRHAVHIRTRHNSGSTTRSSHRDPHSTLPITALEVAVSCVPAEQILGSSNPLPGRRAHTGALLGALGVTPPHLANSSQLTSMWTVPNSDSRDGSMSHSNSNNSMHTAAVGVSLASTSEEASAAPMPWQASMSHLLGQSLDSSVLFARQSFVESSVHPDNFTRLSNALSFVGGTTNAFAVPSPREESVLRAQDAYRVHLLIKTNPPTRGSNAETNHCYHQQRLSSSSFSTATMPASGLRTFLADTDDSAAFLVKRKQMGQVMVRWSHFVQLFRFILCIVPRFAPAVTTPMRRLLRLREVHESYVRNNALFTTHASSNSTAVPSKCRSHPHSHGSDDSHTNATHVMRKDSQAELHDSDGDALARSPLTKSPLVVDDTNEEPLIDSAERELRRASMEAYLNEALRASAVHCLREFQSFIGYDTFVHESRLLVQHSHARCQFHVPNPSKHSHALPVAAVMQACAPSSSPVEQPDAFLIAKEEQLKRVSDKPGRANDREAGPPLSRCDQDSSSSGLQAAQCSMAEVEDEICEEAEPVMRTKAQSAANDSIEQPQSAHQDAHSASTDRSHHRRQPSRKSMGDESTRSPRVDVSSASLLPISDTPGTKNTLTLAVATPAQIAQAEAKAEATPTKPDAASVAARITTPTYKASSQEHILRSQHTVSGTVPSQDSTRRITQTVDSTRAVELPERSATRVNRPVDCYTTTAATGRQRQCARLSDSRRLRRLRRTLAETKAALMQCQTNLQHTMRRRHLSKHSHHHQQQQNDLPVDRLVSRSCQTESTAQMSQPHTPRLPFRLVALEPEYAYEAVSGSSTSTSVHTVIGAGAVLYRTPRALSHAIHGLQLDFFPCADRETSARLSSVAEDRSWCERIVLRDAAGQRVVCLLIERLTLRAIVPCTNAKTTHTWAGHENIHMTTGIATAKGEQESTGAGAISRGDVSASLSHRCVAALKPRCWYRLGIQLDWLSHTYALHLSDAPRHAWSTELGESKLVSMCSAERLPMISGEGVSEVDVYPRTRLLVCYCNCYAVYKGPS